MTETVTPKVLISILNWNALDLTINCVNSILNSTNNNIKIIIVDNASNTNDAKELQQQFPNIQIIKNTKNLGFAGGHNQAIRRAIDNKFDYIWLVNNDCSIQPRDLDGLLNVAESNRTIGIVSPVIVLPETQGDERFQFVGSWFDWKTQDCIRPKDPVQVLKHEEKTPRDMWVTGTAMLLRVEMLAKIGCLDERYFAYYEDNEINARASRAGYVSRMAFDVAISHHSFSTTHDRPPYYFYLCNRNAYLFWAENTPNEFSIGIRRRLLSRTLLEAKSLRRAGLNEHSKACLVGLFDAIRGRFGIIKTKFNADIITINFVNIFPYRILIWLNR